jgi:hypothetical protein
MRVAANSRRDNLYNVINKALTPIRFLPTLQQIGEKTLHITSHKWLTLITLPWKRNRLLFGRPLLGAEYPTLKSV